MIITDFFDTLDTMAPAECLSAWNDLDTTTPIPYTINF